MRSPLLLTTLAALLLAAPAPATESRPQSTPLGAEWSRMLGDLDDALGVPRGMEQYAPPGASAGCDTLYLEVTRLLAQTRYGQPDFYSNPLTGASFMLGTVFAPGFHLMALPEYARLRARPNTAAARGQVVELRARLADMDCYTR